MDNPLLREESFVADTYSLVIFVILGEHQKRKVLSVQVEDVGSHEQRPQLQQRKKIPICSTSTRRSLSTRRKKLKPLSKSKLRVIMPAHAPDLLLLHLLVTRTPLLSILLQSQSKSYSTGFSPRSNTRLLSTSKRFPVV